MTTSTRARNPWAMPDGQLVLPADAPLDQWLAERRGGIGSSDIATLLGVNDHQSEYELWLDKVGRGSTEQTEPMRRGTWLEPHVVDYFAERTGLTVRRCGLVKHRKWPILRATPDRLTADGGIVEVKTIGSTWVKVSAEWAHGGIARHAYVQGQWQLMVTGRTHAWWAAYTIDKEPQIRGPVERDEPLIERMRARAETWWTDHVLANTAPAVDLATITDEEIALRWPDAEPGTTTHAEWPAHVRALLAERAALKSTAKAAADRAKEIDQALKVMTGNAEALLVGGRPVLTLKDQPNNPSVDPALETDHPDIWAGYIRRGTSRRIHICANWENA